MAKRSLQEFLEVSSVDEPTTSAMIHGVVSTVSPMKKGRKCQYFNGTLTDGQKDIRILGFDEAQQKKLKESFISKQAIVLGNCEVIQNETSSDLTIKMKDFTSINESPTKFEVDSTSNQSDALLTIEEIKDNINNKVTFVAKVLHVSTPTQVANGKTKQDVRIADHTNTITLTLWENDIGQLEEKKTYKFYNMMVRTFQGKKYISKPWGAMIDEVPNLTTTVREDPQQLQNTKVLQKVEVIAIPKLQIYPICIGCKSKVLQRATDVKFGICERCQMLQKIDKCATEKSATIIIQSDDVTLTLQAFGSVLETITSGPITQEALLTATPFTVSYNDQELIITDIHRN